MGNVDFKGENDQGNFFKETAYTDNLNAARTNRTIVGVATAAILALSGASASELANYSGTHYDGSAGACATSFQISSYADPHVGLEIGGQTVASGYNDNNMNNFSTVYNTAGGESTLSTSTTGSVAGTYSVFNTGAGMVHAGASGFTLSISAVGVYSNGGFWGGGSHRTIRGGSLKVQIKDSAGNSVSVPHTFADGSQIFSTNGGKSEVVTQPLNGGGVLTTTYDLVLDTDYNFARMNVSQAATGAALVSGTGIAQATGNENAVLALPCSAVDDNNGGGFVPVAATPASPTPQPIPPADDTSGNGAQESL